MTRGTVCDFFFTKLRPEKIYHTMGSRTMRNRPPPVLKCSKHKNKRTRAMRRRGSAAAPRIALRRRHARWHTAYPVVRGRRLWQHETAKYGALCPFHGGFQACSRCVGGPTVTEPARFVRALFGQRFLSVAVFISNPVENDVRCFG